MRHALSLSEVGTRWAKELVRQFVGPNAKVCWIHRSNKCSVILYWFMSFFFKIFMKLSFIFDFVMKFSVILYFVSNIFMKFSVIFDFVS